MTSLVDLRKSSIAYHESVHGRFKEICAPLRDLSIKGYYCFQTKKDGSNLLHSSNFDAAMEHYGVFTHQGKFYTNVVESSSHASKTFFVGGELAQFDSKEDSILHTLWRHNVWNILTLTRIKEDHTVQVWGFWMGREFKDPFGFFAKRTDLINRFIAYFELMGVDLLDMGDKEKLVHFDQSFHLFKKSEDAELEKASVQFLRKTSLKKLVLEHQEQDIEITKRQGQCLYFLAQNHSVKEIGRILDISPRTVEVFLQAVKGKMRVASKRELINMVHEKKWSDTLSLLT